MIMGMRVTGNPGLTRRPGTVFLDRDGVINRKLPEGRFVRNWSEFDLLPEVPSAIRALAENGIRVIVISNQRGIALGLYTHADVDAIHERLNEELAGAGARIDGFFYCPHDREGCTCRKPLPGLYEQAKGRFTEIAAESSIVVGDSISDIEFGRRLGMGTIFVEGNRLLQKPGAEKARELATATATGIAEAVQLILALPRA